MNFIFDSFSIKSLLPRIANITFCYSAQHDTTVACKLAALGMFDGKQPPYSTAFLVELLSDETGSVEGQSTFAHTKG